MSLFSRLIGRLDHILFSKRFAFLSYEQSAEKAMETQYLQSSLWTLKEQFDQLSNEEGITQEEIQTLFKNREEAVTRLWDQFVQHHQDDPERVARLQTGQRNILSRLQELKTNVSGQITTLFDSTNTEIIRARHQDQYLRFLETLRSQGLTTMETPETLTPTPPRRTERLSRDRVQNQAPEPTNTPPVERIPQTAQDLFRPDTNRKETARVNPERQAVSEQFILLARQWRPEINTYFTIAFADKLLSQSDNIPFLKRALEHPEQLKNVVRALYDLYRQTNRTTSRQSIRRFFQQSEPVLSGENIQTSMVELIREMRRETQRDAAQDAWTESVDQETEMFTGRAADDMMNRIDESLLKGEIPSSADLVQLQKFTQYVEREFLSGNALLWTSVQNSHVFPGRYAVPEQYQLPNLSDPPPAGEILSHSKILLQGQFYEVQRILDEGRGPENMSRTVTYVNGLQKNFDLPHFISVLNHLREISPPVDQNGSVNLSQLQDQVQNSAPELSNQLQYGRYLSLLQDFEFNNAEGYKNFPRMLSSFLDQQNLQEKKSTNVWLEQLSSLQGNERMDADQYKFLWVLRFLARTKSIPEKECTIEEFARELIKSHDYRDVLQAPSLRSSEVANGFTDAGGVSAAIRGDRLRYEYRESSDGRSLYQNRVPAIRDVFEFVEKNYELANRRYPAISQRLVSLPWSESVKQLEEAERIGFVSKEGDVVISDRGRTTPAFLFNRQTVEAYTRLKNENVLFREIVAIGLSNRCANLKLGELVNHLLTPNSTLDSVDRVPGGSR
jgi:hypothetical protein